MSESEKLVLSDKSVIPTDDYIFSLIGERKHEWLSIMRFASENYNDTGSWNYYNDGKQWLFKLVNKKKTIFWAGIFSDTFRITFYFGDKAEPVLLASDIPERMKSDFKSAKRYGAIRAVTLLVTDQTDVDNVMKLVNVKHKIK